VRGFQLYVPQRAHGYFNAAIIVFHTGIAGYVSQADLLERVVKWSGPVILSACRSSESRSEFARDAGEFPIGAGRLEGYILLMRASLTLS